MFGSENPLGQQITVQGQSHTYSFAIVGVYESSDEMFGPTSSSSEDVQTDAYIPISTAQHVTGTAGYQSLTVVTASGTNATEFAETIKSFLGKYYARNDDYEVSTYSSESAVETMTDMLNSISLAIAAIAAISLLVGGIGVMNIMLVSITERTREIGVRKALGATNGEIRAQFIIEAMVICFIGGVIGIIAGVILGAVGTKFLGAMTGSDMDLTVSVPVPMMILAAGVSMAIGVFFGYYPANKAAKLDPIDALRFE
jgi:putative ABC transport system permease protein